MTKENFHEKIALMEGNKKDEKNSPVVPTHILFALARIFLVIVDKYRIYFASRSSGLRNQSG